MTSVGSSGVDVHMKLAPPPATCLPLELDPLPFVHTWTSQFIYGTIWAEPKQK